ncbi:MAG: HAMP domain-containing protein [Prevotella sp.]|nr:HAMP domain-containing protein [Prevotella sp.]
MSLLQTVRTSFTTQLTLWVGGFVLVTAGVTIFLLGSYSQGVIHDETLDALQQTLENAALRTDNQLRQMEMTARLERQPLTVDREMIEQLVEESGYKATMIQSLPNARLEVSLTPDTSLGVEDSDYSIYEPIGNRPIGLLVTFPKSDISNKFQRMQSLLLVWGVIGVVTLFVVLYFVVARHLRPLHLLADAAQSIAEGNLETPIPDAHHDHEAGRLQKSLKKMQQSLKAYMDEMQQKQATLSAQNAELQTAYDEAKAYEEMKAKFLTDMTTQMTAPVVQVCQSTEEICRDYNTMTKEQMMHRQTDILQGTETITQLLDELMDN